MMDRRLVLSRISLVAVLLVLALGLSLIAVNQPAPARASEAPDAAGLRLIESTADHVVLELDVPVFDMQTVEVAQQPYQRVTVAGASSLAAPGKPELPKFSALLGVPPEGRITLRVLSDAVETLPVWHPVWPAAGPAPLSGDLQPGLTQRVPDRAAYRNAVVYPAEVARIVDTAWLRDQRLARVEIYPFQYLAAAGSLRWHKQLRIEIAFEGAGTSDRVAAAPTSSVPFEQALRDSLLNYDAARQWRLPAPRLAAGPSITTTQYKIVVDRDGLYRVTYTDLLSAGLVLTAFDPRQLQLTNQGLDVAMEVSGEADGQFDPGDEVVFYGQRLRGEVLAAQHANEANSWITLNGWQPHFNAKMVEKYTNENVYWLRVGDTPGLRIAAHDGTPGSAPLIDYYTATVRAEQSLLWKTTHFNDEDTWFWDLITTAFTGHTVTRTYTTTLTAIAAAPLSATVRAEVTTITPNPPPNPTYRTVFRLNALSNVLEDTIWTGLVRHRMETTTPLTTLMEGTNALTLTVIAQSATPQATLYFDWFEIAYPRRLQAVGNQLTFSDERSGARRYTASSFTTDTVHVLDISNPWQPQRVVSSSISAAAGQFTATFEITAEAPVTYFVGGADQILAPKLISRYAPPDLGSSHGADYLIITHRDFITSMQTLAAYRAAEGLRVYIVDVADLYNQFTDGLYHPVAIKDFLKYVYANWQPPAPTYVLLVGDGHWNFKNFNTALYGTPPNYLPPNLGWVDPYQGEVDTANGLVEIVGDDPLPDMLVGRLPVNTAAEADIVVSKIISYEAQANALPYRQRMLFVADNIPDPKGAGDFVQLSNDLISTVLPSSYQPDRVYANDYGCLPGNSPCPGVNRAITSTLNQTGALFVSYIGHASLNRWGDESFFVNANVATLDNLDRLPIILSMTCLDGYWLYPSPTGSNNGLMETMLRAANGGAVASFSPTGLGVSTGHDRLERGLLNAVFQQGYARLGWAAQAGKLELYASGLDYDLIKTFTIFGDPALRLPTYAVEVAPNTSIKFGSPNTTVLHTLYLTNSGWLTNTPAISLSGNTWPLTVSDPILLPGQSKPFIVSVTIPLTAPLGMTDVATLTFRSADNSFQTVVALATINGLYGAQAAASPVSQQADPGATVTYTVQVTNVGVFTDTFDLSVEGHTWPAQLSTASLIDLPPHGSAAFELEVAAPTDRVAYSADVARVVVASQGGLGFLNQTVVLTTTLKPVYGFALTPSALARTGLSGQTLVYTLALTNTGNATNTFTAQLHGAAWPTVLSPTTGSLAPWASRNLPVRVSIPLYAGRQATDTATIAVTLALGATDSQTATLTTSANPFQLMLPLILKN
jgi:hypothetical protein